ncbi:MAG: hypothetical protein OXT67_13985 [Zetaproteobacteria bacterium]|nr:hypothetical protein [Zetaproteobacteria bacterium]
MYICHTLYLRLLLCSALTVSVTHCRSSRRSSRNQEQEVIVSTNNETQAEQQTQTTLKTPLVEQESSPIRMPPQLSSLTADVASIAGQSSLVIATVSTASEYIRAYVCQGKLTTEACQRDVFVERAFFTASRGDDAQAYTTTEMISAAGSGELTIIAQACQNNQGIRQQDDPCSAWQLQTATVPVSTNHPLQQALVETEKLTLAKEDLCTPLVKTVRDYTLKRKGDDAGSAVQPSELISPTIIPDEQQRQTLEITLQQMYLGGEEACRKLLGSADGNAILDALEEYLTNYQQQREETQEKSQALSQTASEWAKNLGIATAVFLGVGILAAVAKPARVEDTPELSGFRKFIARIRMGQGRVGAGFYAVGKALKYYVVPAQIAGGVRMLFDGSGDTGFTSRMVRQSVGINNVIDGASTAISGVGDPKLHRQAFTTPQKVGNFSARLGGLTAIGATIAGMVAMTSQHKAEKYNLSSVQTPQQDFLDLSQGIETFVNKLRSLEHKIKISQQKVVLALATNG